MKKLYRPVDDSGKFLTKSWFDNKEDAKWWGKNSSYGKKGRVVEKPMQEFYDEINTGKRKRLPRMF